MRSVNASEVNPRRTGGGKSGWQTGGGPQWAWLSPAVSRIPTPANYIAASPSTLDGFNSASSASSLPVASACRRLAYTATAAHLAAGGYFDDQSAVTGSAADDATQY
ncbi:hypothetical protein KCP69_14375 [Salmonella enterica subsp. enterica]|nr:hypothetical protein KCP69_14375 [Salmonella enterica subsp. enterica]